MMRGRTTKALVVIVAIVAVLSGCRSMTGKSAGQNIDDAINRHAGQATASKNAFKGLSAADPQKVMTILKSL